MRPARTTAPTPAQKPGDDIGRDEHALDRNAHLRARPAGRRRRRRSSGPRPSPWPSTSASARDRRARRRRNWARRTVVRPADRGDRVGHAAHRRVADREFEREAAADAQRRERDDEGMRQAADRRRRAPLTAPTRGAGGEHRQHDQSSAELVSRKTSPPTTVASARLAPTERSMPRVRMTSCCPIATMAMTAVWARILPILTGLEKVGRQLADRCATSITRISSGPTLSSLSASETPPAD